MINALDHLMEEHQLILQVLASFNRLADELRKGRVVSRLDLADFNRFFRDFADRCHHGKEEDRLFAAMIQTGFPKDSGPIAVMLAEHAECRSHVRVLRETGQLSGPLTVHEVRLIIMHVSQFVALLSAHIAREDNILYPMARSVLTDVQLRKLDLDCDSFERNAMVPGEVKKLNDLATRLMAAYPAEMKPLKVNAPVFAYH